MSRFTASEAATTACSAAPSAGSNVSGTLSSRNARTADASAPCMVGNSGRFCCRSYVSNARSAFANSSRHPAFAFFTAARSLAAGSELRSGFTKSSQAIARISSASISASSITLLMVLSAGRGSLAADGSLYIRLASDSNALTKCMLPPPQDRRIVIASETARTAPSNSASGFSPRSRMCRISTCKTLESST